MKKSLKKGFTLIELLVVVAIIAILALIVLLALNPVEMARRSRDSRRLSDLGTVRRAIDLALADKQTLAITGWVPLSPSTSVSDFAGMGTLNVSKYLSVVPQDPMNTANSVQLITNGDPCGKESVGSGVANYEFRSDGENYVLRTRLESLDNCEAIKTDGNIDSYYELGTDPGLNL